jgi:hypothetical protein
MENLKHLNWTSQSLKLSMVNLESFKLDAPNLAIGHRKPMIPQIEHGKSENFKLDIPNLEIGRGRTRTPQIGHPRPLNWR